MKNKEDLQILADFIYDFFLLLTAFSGILLKLKTSQKNKKTLFIQFSYLIFQTMLFPFSRYTFLIYIYFSKNIPFFWENQ